MAARIMKPRLTHLDARGAAHMVDVGGKVPTTRRAVACAVVRLPAICRRALTRGIGAKGDVLQVARIAGILAAKRVPELIPLCHQVPLSKTGVDFTLRGNALHITAHAQCTAATGVEMEALTAATVAALTVYDMLKGLSHDLVIDGIELLSKDGGRSGLIQRTPQRRRR